MVYIDENNNVLEDVDLTKGYLIDCEWTDHPAIKQEGHFEYDDLVSGRLQKYVIDVPAQAAWREVTKQKYILYSTSEEDLLKERVTGLETQLTSYEESYAKGVQDA